MAPPGTPSPVRSTQNFRDRPTKSVVKRRKMKRPYGLSLQEWSLRLNLTQHGETYPAWTLEGLTD